MHEEQMKKFLQCVKSGYFNNPVTIERVEPLKGLSELSYDDFCHIPVMTKSDIRSTSIETRELESGRCVGIFSSSGSTGKRTYYKFSQEDQDVFNETARELFGRLGVNSDDVFAVCAPVGEGIMAHCMIWEAIANCSGYTVCPTPSPSNVMEMLDNIPVTIIAGLPSVLDFSLESEKGTQSHKTHLRMMISGGHYMSEAKRDRIESVWGIEWYNAYGISEFFGPLMCECHCKNGFHYNQKCLFVEIVDVHSKEPIEGPGKIGIMLLTPLWKKGSPLIRYWTDDYAEWIDEPCTCGAFGRRIRILGRQCDVICINGRYIFPNDIEEILVRNSRNTLAYFDIEDDDIVCFLPEINGSCGELERLFDTEIHFKTKSEWPNINRPKPYYFSKTLKQRLSDR